LAFALRVTISHYVSFGGLDKHTNTVRVLGCHGLLKEATFLLELLDSLLVFLTLLHLELEIIIFFHVGPCRLFILSDKFLILSIPSNLFSEFLNLLLLSFGDPITLFLDLFELSGLLPHQELHFD
jgi:hypothetical protein